jgi:hypothetical protein
MEHYDIVKATFDEMVAKGLIYDIRPSSEQERKMNEMKAFFTRRAAYRLYQKDPSFGLLRKTDGLNVMGLSVDVVIKTNGQCFDIATNNVKDNGYAEVLPVNPDAFECGDLIYRYVTPTAELAGLTDSTPIPDPKPVPPIITEINEKLFILTEKIEKVIEALIGLIKVEETMHSETQNKLQIIMNKSFNVDFPSYKSAGLIKIVLHPIQETKDVDSAK